MDAQELKATLLDLKSRLEDIKVNVFQIEDKKKSCLLYTSPSPRD